MFELSALGSPDMCTKGDTKHTAGDLVYLRLEYKNLTVGGKVPSDLFLWRQWETLATKTEVGGGGPAEFLHAVRREMNWVKNSV